MLKITRYNISDKNFSGLKIVFLGDYHFGPHQKRRLNKLIKLVNNENPDLVLSVGDFIARHTKKTTISIEYLAQKLGEIKSKYGFYTVLGNHDTKYFYTLSNALTQNEITVLSNNSIDIDTSNGTLYIAGIKDLKTDFPKIEKALDKTQSPIIFLTHNPDVFPDIPQYVNLTLAGHTHGGQIRIPFYGAIYTASDFGKKYESGLIKENGKKMIVTKGIGVSFIPIRFNCIPEIIVITFE